MWILGLKGLNSFWNTTRPLEGTQILFLCLKTHFSNLKEILCISARLPNISKMMISIHILCRISYQMRGAVSRFSHRWSFPMEGNFSVPCPEIMGNHQLQFFGSLKIHANLSPKCF